MAGHPFLNPCGPAEKRKPPGYLFDLFRRDSIYLSNFSNRSPAAKTHMIGYHGGAFTSVGALHKINHFIPLVPGKIHVNVGKISPVGTEKSTKEELVADRIHVGNTEQIAYQTCSSTAASTGYGSLADNIRHHQEIVSESLVSNEGEFFFQTFGHRRIHFSIAPLHPFQTPLAQEVKMILLLIPIVRKDLPAELPISMAAAGKMDRLGQSLGTMGKVGCHPGCRFQPLSRLNHFITG